jgi:hypothetical protein
LKAHDIDIWIDQERIKPSDTLVSKISDGLSGANVALVLFSKQYADKVWTQEEMAALVYAAVISAERKVLVVRLDDTPLPPLLAHRVWLKHPSMLKVAEVIRDLVAGHTSPAPVSTRAASAPVLVAPKELDSDTLEALAREVVAAFSAPANRRDSLQVSVNGRQLTVVVNHRLVGRDMLAEIRSRLEVMDIHRAYVRDLREELAEGALGKFKTGFRLALDRRLESLEESRRLIRECVEAITERAELAV